jgi:hypothetical protein
MRVRSLRRHNPPRRPTRAQARVGSLSLTALVALTGCSGHQASKSANESAPNRLLTVRSVPVPPLGLPNHVTAGSYPQVSGGGIDLTAVNSALRDEVLQDQEHFRQQELSRYGTSLYNTPYPGQYHMAFSSSLMSATAVVVSTMYPSLELFPSGNDGVGWMHMTAPVSSGQPVELVGLLRSPVEGLRVIAGYVEHQLVATSECIREDAAAGADFRDGFAPTEANYRNFALTPRGLDIGLGQGQVASEVCDTFRVTVPWSVALPQLNATGRRLVNGLR